MPPTITPPAPFRPLFGMSRLRGFAPHAAAFRLEDFTITAAADGETPGSWHAVLVVEGVRTTDGREIARGALTTRDLPLPLMGLDRTTWGHQEAVLVGMIETAAVNDAGQWEATGTYLATDDGRRFADLVDQGLRWVSVDLEVTASRTIEIVDDSDVWLDDDWWSQQAEAMGVTASIWIDEWDYTTWWEQITEGRIMGATIVPFPAFPQAQIAAEGKALPPVSADNGLPTIDLPAGPLMASSGPADLMRPPAWWFDDPQLSGPTHMTVTDDGRVFGHVATWSTAHVGLPGQVNPPRNPTGAYAYFRTGVVRCARVDDDGNEVEVEIATGVLSVGGGHADPTVGIRPAAEHYDSTSSAFADVACGEDAHGIWVAGCRRPGTTPEQVRTVRASDVSGDWRVVGGQYEMMAVLVVNVPGFPIPRSLAAAGAQMFELPVVAGAEQGWRGGHQVSLVAAGILHVDPMGDALREMAKRIAALEAVTNPLRGQAVDALAARIGA